MPDPHATCRICGAIPSTHYGETDYVAIELDFAIEAIREGKHRAQERKDGGE